MKDRTEGSGTSRVERGMAPDTSPRLSAIVGMALLMTVPLLGLGASRVYSDWAKLEASRENYRGARLSLTNLLEKPALPELALAQAQHGRDIFVTTCAACHSVEGTGVAGLGKDLVRSWYIASLDDGELKKFILVGRPASHPANTTQVDMPPKGGREDLTEEDISDVVVYLRGLQDARRMPVLPPISEAALAKAVAPVTEADKAAALAAAGGDAELAEYIAHGSKVFASSCVSCHGKDGRGLPKLGKDLVTSEFIRKNDDDAMLAFLQKGRSVSDPANTTKVDMPPKGGNPALSEDDLLDIIAYLRSLQTAQVGAKP